LRAVNKSLRDNRGMTIVEIMIAIAVFGIFLTTCGSVYHFIGKFNADTLDQLMMTELAQSEIEKIKTGAKTVNYPSTSTVNYPNDVSPQQSYTVRYDSQNVSAAAVGGSILKITTGDSPNDYVFGAWIPPQKTLHLYVENPTGEGGTYNLGSWTTDPNTNTNINGWEIITSPEPALTTVQGAHGGSDPIFYNQYYFNPPFSYTVDAIVTSLENGHCETGMAIDDNSNNDAKYLFYLSVDNSDRGDLVVKYPGGSFKPMTDIAIQEGRKYYFTVDFNSGDPGTIILNFGYYGTGNSKIAILNNDYPDNKSHFSRTGHNYYLGLHDTTAQTQMTYTLPTLLGEECYL